MSYLNEIQKYKEAIEESIRQEAIERGHDPDAYLSICQIIADKYNKEWNKEWLDPEDWGNFTWTHLTNSVRPSIADL